MKFIVWKIKLLKSFDVFLLPADSKVGITKMERDLIRLAYKINEKLTKEFDPSEGAEGEAGQPAGKEEFKVVRTFETYAEHHQEHTQLARILKYVKKFLKTLIIQVLYDKFCLKRRMDSKSNRRQEIKDIKFDFQKLQILIVSGKQLLSLEG